MHSGGYHTTWRVNTGGDRLFLGADVRKEKVVMGNTGDFSPGYGRNTCANPKNMNSKNQIRSHEITGDGRCVGSAVPENQMFHPGQDLLRRQWGRGS